VNKSELTNLLDSRKCKSETRLHVETCKRQKLNQKFSSKLEEEIADLKK